MSTLQRHAIIINKLRQKPCSFEEILDYLELQRQISGDDLSCSQRTFQRDIQQIERQYRIEIKYSHSKKAYYIEYDGNEEHRERLMESFDIFNALNVASAYTNVVVMEKRKALGTENLYGLLHAVKNRKQVAFDYQKFSEDPKSRRTLHPVAIKEARNRWYILGKDTKDGLIKSFGLDRISELNISSRTFERIEYDPQADYRHSFGIINGGTEIPEKIILSFSRSEGNFIETLPLHHSQELIEKNDKEWKFQYFLLPTFDFIMEILSHGDKVKVLEPKSLQKKVKQRLKAALENY